MKVNYLILALPWGCALAGPTVNLGYSEYQGVTLQTVDQFLGMRYAAPPTGNSRWRTPSAPLSTSGVQDATEWPDVCLPVGVPYLTEGQSEDCLFINVFKPSTATANSKLPVWVFIQGGGFAALGSPKVNGTDVITQSGSNVVVVTFNYRVGLFGFLASSEIQKNGNCNAGLHDQRAALQWVQTYISQFGGDPDKVVIHGESAGAQSVSVHLIAYGGQNQNLFAGAAMESLPQLTQLSVSEFEFIYNDLVSGTGCSSSADTLACLRGLDVPVLQQHNQEVPYPDNSVSPLWEYVPVVDGDILQTRVYEAFEQGKFVKVPVLFGDVTDEGSMFAPNASTAEQVQDFFKNQYPYLTNQGTASITTTYPQDSAPEVPDHAAWFPAASLAYGDALFDCPTVNFARYIHNAGQDVFFYRFNVLTTSNEANGLGVPHGSDMNAIFGGGYDDAPLSNTMLLMGYYLSFVRDLNPNTYAFSGSPSWPTYTGTVGGVRLLMNNSVTTTEALSSTQISRCDFWESLAEDMQV